MSLILFFPKILLYKRYIDYIFMITKATPIEMLTFLNYLNSRTEHVNFTMECDPVSISFLDVSVYICDGKLHTDLYRKPTDHNTILRGDSFHPRPLIKSLPISQFNPLSAKVAKLRQDVILNQIDRSSLYGVISHLYSLPLDGRQVVLRF